MSCRDRGARGRLTGASGEMLLVAVIGLMSAMPATACAQVPIEVILGLRWVGQRVVQTTRGFALRDDRPMVTRSAGRIYVYRVQEAEGLRLWLEVEGNVTAQRGWSTAWDVVPIDRASTFFTQRIQANLQDGFSCLMRAAIRTEAIERQQDLLDGPFPRNPFADPDNAIPPRATLEEDLDVDHLRLSPAGPDADLNDFTSAIRVDPRSAAARRGRGLILVRRKEYDRADAGVAPPSRFSNRDGGARREAYTRGRRWGGVRQRVSSALSDRGRPPRSGMSAPLSPS
jgi:hypothetical protein